MTQYGDQLCVGFYNPSEGAEVWSYDGSNWTSMADGGFGEGSINRDAMSMATLDGSLYVGTNNKNGCEVWSYDGSDWNMVDAIGNGFGNPDNIGAQSMVACEGGLIVGTYNGEDGCEVWRWDYHDTTQLAQIGRASCRERV